MPETIVEDEVAVENCEATKCKSENESGENLVATLNGNSSPIVDAKTVGVEETTTTSTYDLNQFQLQRILNNNTRNKSIALLGTFPHVSDSDNAIVLFEKQAFQEGDVATKKQRLSEGEEVKCASESGTETEENSYFGTDLKVQTEFINNIYGSYQCTPPSKLSGSSRCLVKTRKELFTYLIESEATNFDGKMKKLEEYLLTFGPFSEEDSRKFNNDFKHLKCDLKTRWISASYKKDRFLKQNESWLNMAFTIPNKMKIVSGGRPQKLFSESCERSKRRKTETLRKENNLEMLTFATQTKLGVKATVVYPATEKHIEKYSICQKYVINETPELYKDITLPYITASQFSLEWVYNILEHKQETERIIFEDPDPENGFILLPDLKWDGHNSENLYVLVITHKRDIKSLRDLNASHLPMLRNIRNRAAAEIYQHYGLAGTQLRMYFHYQPSFYHMHVHINPVRNEAPGIWCEKSHMLDTVINNLELLPDYYEKASLPFVLYEGNKLLDLYEAKMPIIKKAAAADENDDGVEDNIEKPKIDDGEDDIRKNRKIDDDDVDIIKVPKIDGDVDMKIDSVE